MFSGWGLLWTFPFSTMKYSTLQIALVDWPRWIIRHCPIFQQFWKIQNIPVDCIENISGSIWRRHCGVGHIVRGVLQGQHSHHAGTFSQILKDSMSVVAYCHILSHTAKFKFNKDRKKVQSLEEKLNLSDSWRLFGQHTDRWSSNHIWKYWIFLPT